MNKRTLTITLATTAAVIAAVVGLQPEKDWQYYLAQEPNANDRTLTGTFTGSYNLTASGTVEDPIVVRADNAVFQCVYITGSNVIWAGSTVHNCDTFGIRSKGDNNWIIKNHVYDTVRMNLNKTTGKCLEGDWHSAIRIADATGGGMVGNVVHDNCGEGLSFLRSDNLWIEGNTVYDNFSVNIYPDQASNIIIRNNYSYSTGNTNFYKGGLPARGILIGAESYTGFAFNVHDILIEGNTLESVKGINYYAEQAGTPYNVIVRGNTFINVPAPLISLGSWATIDGTPVPATRTVTVAVSKTPTQTPVPATRTPVPNTPVPATPTIAVTLPTPTAYCIPAHNVWVCDRKP